ncbi:iron-enterobactin transporter ATP-binding protein [Alkalicoccus urumqiensis]|uniref:Iron-enterobactin transporter ATP-binding protein n=2 Tax=Alkalicoccus urumqiensis TaxID=1548213 RepID=A0A2P6MIJ2_ALKUR|nr:ABC transporter ATP-binding protein [Alkalicoccus urumqiensis]PRO66112.1 iron-enterobactin transporter ATP-binding protein [Alkalicoccus urumqiensis]
MQVSNLQAGYGGTPIIDELTTSIPEGKITTIIGSNGCGKSTLLKACTRLLSPESGGVALDGRSITQMPTKELAKTLAILPQTQQGAGGLTVYELVSYGRFPHQRGFGRLTRTDKEKIAWAMEMTGTTDFADQPVDGLSGGQRQRVWIAMALAQDTEMIFLDEPTTYLDMAHQLEVLELLQRLNREEGRTIVMVLHDLNQAARFSDHIIAMKEGEIVHAGSSKEVIQCDILRHVFEIEAIIGEDPMTGCPMCMTYHLLQQKQTAPLKQAVNN